MKVLLVAALALALPLDLRGEADLVLAGGKIWTGDPARRFVEAVAVRGERIAAVGSSDEIRKLAGPATRVIELEGRLVTPGFIDGHLHFTMGGFGLSRVQLRDAAIARRARPPRSANSRRRCRRDPGSLGGDWDHELWPRARAPGPRQ